MTAWRARSLFALFALAPSGCTGGCRREAVNHAEAPFEIASPYELTTLDPHKANTVSNFAVLSNVYEPLVATDADMKVKPALATAWENPDPLTWRLHLRPGVAFHSGRKLRAEDVVFSLRRLMEHRDLGMRVFVQNLTSVRALDAATIELSTSRPSHNLLSKLHFALVVPEGSTAETLHRRADGTGPFVVREWDEGRSLVVRRNDDYWGPRPTLGLVRFTLGEAPEAAASGLLEGRYQLMQGSGKIAEALLRESPLHEVLRHDNIYVKYLGYDLVREVTPFCPIKPNPFRNALVRRALDLVLDRQVLVEALPVHAVPATQVVPRFIFGFDPSLPATRSSAPEARALLEAEGLGGGFSVTLHTRHIFAGAARVVQKQLAPIGVQVEVKPIDEDEFFSLHDGGRLTLWITRYGCPSGDASDFLNDVIHSRDPSDMYGHRNGGYYSNPRMDAAIRKSEEVEDVEDRRQAVQRMIRQVSDERIMLPLYLDQDVYGIERAYSWQPRNDSYIRLAEVKRR
jgi:peptide/nickel transport system substrate-binding protein